MNEKAEFAVEILKEYATQNQVSPRSTSDLSKLEQWLIIELLRVKKLTLPVVVVPKVTLVCNACRGKQFVYSKKQNKEICLNCWEEAN